MIEERRRANSWFNSTVQKLFRETCAVRGDKDAIVYEGQHISFNELLEQVNRLSWALIQLGVKPGDRVAMLPTSSPEFTYVYLAVLQVGAWINPLNLLWGEIEFQGILPRNDPKVIIAVDNTGGRDYIELLKRAIPDLSSSPEGVTAKSVPSLRTLVSVSREQEHYDGFLDFGDLMRNSVNYDPDVIARLVDQSKPTDIQFICQTSGSTGLSKGALWNHRAPLASAHFFNESLMVDEQDAYLNVMPYYHNGGFVVGMTSQLVVAGTTLHLMESFNPQSAVEIMRKYRPNVAFMMEPHLQGIFAVLDTDQHIFSLDKIMGPFAFSTYDRLLDEMCPGDNPLLVRLYGQTENGPLISAVEPDCVNTDLRKYSDGRPLPGVQLVIKDVETGEPVGPGKQGAIWYKSPYMFSGYYKQEAKSAELYDKNGYFNSGDFGTFGDGYLRFLGRLGGVVKTGGENVSTAYVTVCLMRIFADEFEDAFTVGIPDTYWGTKLVSWVRLAEGKMLKSLTEIKNGCKGKMAQYEIPKAFLVWEGQWPVTEIGKIDFKTLEKKARDMLND